MQSEARRRALRRGFAQALRQLRERSGISQEGLALEIGMGRSYLSGLERGVHSPTIETVDRFLPTLNVSLTQFAAEIEKAIAKPKSH